MPCYYPLRGWRARRKNNETGKRPIVFKADEGFTDMPVELPCGRCIGCRLEKSRQWAARCVHEASLHDENCFITLTYNNEHIPDDHSLRKRDHQLFLKRLRKRTGAKFKFFHCGEYGELNNRPHYHTLLFGFDFPDKYLWTIRNGFPLYRSPLLEQTWTAGNSLLGEVTFESAAYVSRYCLKKITGDQADKHYQILDKETGEIHRQTPEYATMSRGGNKTGPGGIGADWLAKYQADTDKDFITIRGTKMRLPKYYDQILETHDELAMMARRKNRKRELDKRADDNTPARLRQKEAVKRAQLSQLPRTYENEN